MQSLNGPHLPWSNEAKMSEEKVTLEFLARQLRGMRDDVLSLKEDMGVLTAIVLRRA